MHIHQKALALVLSIALVAGSFGGTAAFAAESDGTEDGEETNTVSVETFDALETALSGDAQTIQLTADITAETPVVVTRPVTIDGGGNTLKFMGLKQLEDSKEDDGLILKADSTVKDLTVNANLLVPTDWQGLYAIHVYQTNATLENVTATGGNGGILVNGSTVTLAGTIDVSGNGFSGIEVSQGKDVTGNPKLTVSEDGAALKNDSEDYKKPTVWEDGVDEGTIGDDVLEALKLTETTVTTESEATQPQYYLDIKNSGKPYFELEDVPEEPVLTEDKISEDGATGQIAPGFTSEGRTPVSVHLYPGEQGYERPVRIVVNVQKDEADTDDVQLVAQDSDGDWWNIVKAGWGAPGGFSLADATTPVYLVATEPGTYTATISLVDAGDANTVLATAEASVTAATGTVSPAADWKGPAGDPEQPLAAKAEQSFVFPFETTGDVSLSELQLDIYLGDNTGKDRKYGEAAQLSLRADESVPLGSTGDNLLNALQGLLSPLADTQKANTIKLLKAVGVEFDAENKVTSIAQAEHNISYDFDETTGVGSWAIKLDTTKLLGGNGQGAIEFLVTARTSDDEVSWGNNNYVSYGEDTKAYRYAVAERKTSDEVAEAIDGLTADSSSSEIAAVVNSALVLPDEEQKKIDSAEVTKLEELIDKNDNIEKDIPAPVTAGFANTAKLPKAPTAAGLLLAAGVKGNESEETVVALKATQTEPAQNALVTFDLTLTKKVGSDAAQTIHEELPFPVTVSIRLPANFVKRSGYTYSLRHGSETLPLAIAGAAGGYTATFTTTSFSPFSIVETYGGGSHDGGDDDDDDHHSGGSNSGTTPVTPSVPAPAQNGFVSDTTRDFAVAGTYTFRITSRNGAFPNFVVGTPGVFNTQLVRTAGSNVETNYYIRLIAIGKPGDKAGIYVNGVKVLTATVGTAASLVKSDTTAPFKVAGGKSYVFKLTADSRPALITGNSSVFRTAFIKADGRDYYFRVTAVGKPGQAAGFYINSDRTPVAVATVA